MYNDKFDQAVKEQEAEIRDKASELVEAGYTPFEALMKAQEQINNQRRGKRSIIPMTVEGDF